MRAAILARIASFLLGCRRTPYVERRRAAFAPLFQLSGPLQYDFSPDSAELVSSRITTRSPHRPPTTTSGLCRSQAPASRGTSPRRIRPTTAIRNTRRTWCGPQLVVPRRGGHLYLQGCPEVRGHPKRPRHAGTPIAPRASASPGGRRQPEEAGIVAGLPARR